MIDLSQALHNRYEFTLLYDVENGNPNGDPDAEGMPRVDPETGLGRVTDVCIKRKVRKYVQLATGDRPPNRIYVQEGIPLNQNHVEAYKAVGLPTDDAEFKPDQDEIKLARDWLCTNFYDIRAFGAVMNTKVKAGSVTGPVQIPFSQSIDPVLPQEISITRVTVTREEDAQSQRTIGRKWIVPYGLYRLDGYVSAKLANDPAKGTGFSEEDLDLFWQALLNMFEHDHSAMRGKMSTRRLFVFKHASELGNAPAHKLFEMIRVQRKDGVEVPRHFSDYEVSVEGELPQGVELRDIA